MAAAVAEAEKLQAAGDAYKRELLQARRSAPPLPGTPHACASLLLPLMITFQCASRRSEISAA